jgi:hypothetical protein
MSALLEFQCVLFGGIPAGATRKTLRWLHRQHLHRAAMRSQQPLEISPAAHLDQAARCRRAMSVLAARAAQLQFAK